MSRAETTAEHTSPLILTHAITVGYELVTVAPVHEIDTSLQDPHDTNTHTHTHGAD